MAATLDLVLKARDEWSAALRSGAIGVERLNSVAASAARGGIAQLAGDIPVVGSAIGNLVAKLTGFELALAGLAGVGVGFITFLKSVQSESTAALTRVEALAIGIGTNLKDSMLEVQKIRLKALGDDLGALGVGAEQAIQRAKAARDAAIQAARSEFEQRQDPNSFKNLSLGLTDFALGTGFERANVSTADSERRTKEAAAEAEFASAVMRIREQLKADTGKIEEDRAKKYSEERANELKAAEDAAAKEKQLLRSLTDEAVSILKDLPGGDELFKSFAVDQFVQKTQAEIDKLSTAIDAGKDASGLYAKAVDFLKQKMQEAKDTGVVPMTHALQQQAEVLQEAATRGFDDMGREIDSLTMDFLDSTEVMARYEAGLMSVGQTAAAVTEQIGAMAQATTQLGTAANTFFQASQTPSITGSSLAGLQGSGPGGLVTAGDILGGTVRQGPQATPAPATKVAGITVNITNTQNMDPNAMVGVLLPALRRAAVRGLA